MATKVLAVNQTLLDIAQRLTHEYEDIAAGSVLRCYARVLRRSVRRGCAADDLPSEAERLTRAVLTRRRNGGRVCLPPQSGDISEWRGEGAYVLGTGSTS